MGRPSKLTDKQWAEIQRRLLEGEAIRVLAREFGVSDTAIRSRKSLQVEEIKVVANQLVAADKALKVLQISSQTIAQTLAQKLIMLGDHLLGAATYGAATSHRLAGIAHGKVAEIDDAAPLDDASLTSLKGIAVMTRMANDASQIGCNLLAANKDRVAGLRDAPAESPDLASLTPQEAAQQYAQFIAG